ncbi:hypothetical protein [Vibrio aquimaris]|uniref:YopD protein n=1 Tax=Vibrio aquimaris TaxID=2587862 RepID=A0A5P9CPV9_9VIBR|nr:hypothetical protein [Vibrio aquimaris]QFT27732.1 YopD protein [Vibrio aquimaris]
MTTIVNVNPTNSTLFHEGLETLESNKANDVRHPQVPVVAVQGAERGIKHEVGDLELPQDNLFSQAHVKGALAAIGGTEGSEVSLAETLILFHQMSMEHKEAERQERKANVAAIQTSIHSQADKIRDSARSSFIGGIVSGATSIVGGLTTMRASFKSVKLNLNEQQTQQVMGFANGKSQIYNAAGGMVNSVMELHAGNAKAEGKELEAEQAGYEALKEDSKARFDYSKQLMEEVKDALKNYSETNNQMMSSIVQSM